MIPVSEPHLGGRELEYVQDCIESGWISSAGQYLDRFEAAWAERNGRRHGIAVTNGSAALQAAVAVLDLAPGDEIIMPTFTIISCATAAVFNECVPVLVDTDSDTWCMDVDAVARRIGPRTRAVMPVHMYGHPVDMDPLLDLAAEHGLAVIEDAAEAHGAEYYSAVRDEWLPCGGMSDLACFSFYANKLVTTGEGGMVLTDDDRLAARLRSFRNLEFQPDRRFLHERLGLNLRMTNLQAAIGLAQVERFDEIVARKRAIAQRYHAALADVPGLQTPPEAVWARSVYWVYGIVLDDDIEMDAAQFAERLREVGVDTRPFFLGLHEQPALRRMGLFDGEHHPVAERLSRRGLYLPSGVGMTDGHVDEVAGRVREVLVP